MTRKCIKCDKTKPLSEFRRCASSPTGAFAYCRVCASAYDRARNIYSNPKANPNRMWVAGEYVSTSHPLYRPGRYASWDEVGAGREIPARKPLPSIPGFTPWVTKAQSVRNDTAVRHGLRNWHLAKRSTCQFTGDPDTMSDVCHIDAWANCDDDAKRDPENTFFALASINVAMERHGHYLHADGCLCVMPGHERIPHLEKSGVYDIQIEMTPKRKKYALRAWKRLIEQGG